MKKETRQERYEKYIKQRELLQEKLNNLDKKIKALEIESKMQNYNQLENYLATNNLSFDDLIKSINKSKQPSEFYDNENVDFNGQEKLN